MAHNITCIPLKPAWGQAYEEAVSRFTHQVVGEFASTDGMVEAALVTVLQDEPCFQQVWPRVRCSVGHLGSGAPIGPVRAITDQIA